VLHQDGKAKGASFDEISGQLLNVTQQLLSEEERLMEILTVNHLELRNISTVSNYILTINKFINFCLFICILGWTTVDKQNHGGPDQAIGGDFSKKPGGINGNENGKKICPLNVF
jgi:hypothetical protein